MNGFPVLKCMVWMQRYIVVMPVSFVVFFAWWSVSSTHFDKEFPLGMIAFCTWFMTTMPYYAMLDPRHGNPNEFWCTLPFSPTRIFLARFFAQQVLFLVILFFCVAVLGVLGVGRWGGEQWLAVFNVATCGFTLNVVVHRFLKPQEIWSTRSIFRLILVAISITFGSVILLAVGSQASSFGPWPIFIATVVGVPLYFSMKRSFGEVEPLTERKLPRELDYRDAAIVSEREDSCRSQKMMFHPCPETVAAPVDFGDSDRMADHLLDGRFSPVSRYLLRTIWLRWYWFSGFVLTVFMLFAAITFLYARESAPLFGLFIGAMGGFTITQWSRSVVCALNPLPIRTWRLFAWIFGPWVVMIAVVTATMYFVSSHKICMNCGDYQSNSPRPFFRESVFGDWLDDIIGGSSYYGKGLHVPVEERRADAGPIVLSEEPGVSQQPVNFRSNTDLSPDANTQIVAKYFSDSLWVYYGVAARPEELVRYNKAEKTWSVSFFPFIRQCHESKMRLGLLGSLMILFGFLLGISWGGAQRDQNSFGKVASSKTGMLSEKFKRWRGRLIAWGLFLVLTSFWVTIIPNNPVSKYFYLRLFFATHFVECLVVLLLCIPWLYWLSLRALRRVY